MGTLSGLVDATFVINLERSKDRMAFMKSQLKAHGIHYERIEAVDGSKLSSDEKTKHVTPFCRKLCTPSMMGCALSHIRLWRKCLDEGYDRVMVMEDDAELTPGFVKGVRTALSNVPRDFDVLLCGCHFLCNKDRKYPFFLELTRLLVPTPLRSDTRTWGNVFVPESFAGTHCYIVSRQGCEKLLKAIPRANFHIDLEMNHSSLNVYAVSPDLAFQRDMSMSTIASYEFPKTLGPALGRWKDDKRVPYSYYMSSPFAQIGGHKINAWTVVFLVLGIMHARTAPFVAGFLLAEILVGGHVFVPLVAFAVGVGLRRAWNVV